MIKIRNKSESNLTLSFNRKDNSVLTETLKPKQFIFLENVNLTKSLIIQQRKDNITVEEHEGLPSWMETEKVYTIYPTDPELKAAMSEMSKTAIITALHKEQEADKTAKSELVEKIKEASIQLQEAREKTETFLIEQGYTPESVKEGVPIKNKGGRPKGALNKKTQRKLKKAKKVDNNIDESANNASN